MFKFVTTVSKFSKREHSILAFDANITKKTHLYPTEISDFFFPTAFYKDKTYTLSVLFE